MTRKRTPLSLALAASLLCAGLAGQACLATEAPAAAATTAARHATHAGHAADAKAEANRAMAVLEPASDSDVEGKLEFVTVPAGVRVTGELTGLEPNTLHGFHIHANGDCSAPDAKSAGPHYNPEDRRHGRAGTGPHHAGDIPNQVANGEGAAPIDEIIHDVTLGTGSDTDLVGRAVIVHADPDDYTSQPSGAAGARIACGVITAH